METVIVALRAKIKALRGAEIERRYGADPEYLRALDDIDGWAAGQPDYEMWVRRFAVALHRDCVLEWDAIAAVDPGRALTLHDSDAHYGRAHDLERRLFPELDTTA